MMISLQRMSQLLVGIVFHESYSLTEDKYEINWEMGGDDYHLRILDTSGSDEYFDNLHGKVSVTKQSKLCSGSLVWMGF